MNSIVEIDAGENGEDIGLQERDQQLKCGQRNHHAERQHGAEVPENAKARQQRE